MSSYALGRSPDIWEDPEQFRPVRVQIPASHVSSALQSPCMGTYLWMFLLQACAFSLWLIHGYQSSTLHPARKPCVRNSCT